LFTSFGTNYEFGIAALEHKNTEVMRTLKLFISIILVALATAAAGQKTSIKERLNPSMNHELVYVNTEYRAESTKMEVWMDNVLNWFSPRGHNPYLEGPEVSMAFHFDRAEVIFETEPVMENWMTVPFYNEGSEENLETESWMTTSFINDLEDSGPALEVWMTTPFERSLEEEVVTVEYWMVRSFDKDLSEETLILEEWMLTPFETDEEIKVEEWMTGSWI
jgi:hypothetical protein